MIIYPTKQPPLFNYGWDIFDRWASFSQADWDRYHSYEWDEADEDVLIIGATTADTAERAFRYIVPFNGLQVYPDIVTRHIWHPWSPTYWKTVPAGNSVQFKCKYFENYEEQMRHFYGDISTPEGRAAVQLVRQEYEYFHHWYRRHPECLGLK